jgi:FkbM family methyltransferase
LTGQLVSYAQNFEDVMLWRALKHVDAGFYIDVGAFSPVDDSVTKAFYDSGWSGINIEPDPSRYRTFLDARPRDINLMLALGERSDQLTMHFVLDTGLSTLDEGEARERRLGGYVVEPGLVDVHTLSSIWTEHVPALQEVHFLKVDVEGYERQVLLGNAWSINRPWIVVVEATRPTTTEPSFTGWEAILTDSGYYFVYADGLNRFYVAAERRALAEVMASPPNVFDGFVRAAEFEATERVRRAEARARTAEARLKTILSSRSWRATAPLRAAAGCMRRAKRERTR